MVSLTTHTNSTSYSSGIQGWYAVRREWKKLMAAFLAIAAVVFTGWVVMLKSWRYAGLYFRFYL